MDSSTENDPKYAYNDVEVYYGPAEPMTVFDQPSSQPPGYTQLQQKPTNTTVLVNQPTQQTPSNMTVVVNQPIQQTNPLMTTTFHGHRRWTTGPFDCFSNMSNCCFTCFCYCCALCSLRSRMGEPCTCCVPGGDINLRTKIRTVGGITGSMCDDCLVVTCCRPCAACQEARELSNMGVP